jgi:hypothetical protein
MQSIDIALQLLMLIIEMTCRVRKFGKFIFDLFCPRLLSMSMMPIHVSSQSWRLLLSAIIGLVHSSLLRNGSTALAYLKVVVLIAVEQRLLLQSLKQ